MGHKKEFPLGASISIYWTFMVNKFFKSEKNELEIILW